MFIAPLTDDDYDDRFAIIIRMAQTAIENDDDFLMVCAGDPGSGKTRLMLHAYDRFAGSAATIQQVALNQTAFVHSLQNASRATIKFIGYDEANVTSREAITRWNRKLIDIYMNIRGLNIFHWWNNPSIQMLDKPFIEERVKGIIFILTKHQNKPRSYYYFTQKGFLRLLDDRGDLKHNTVKKYGREYAFYQGWFRDYHGPLLPQYLKNKEDHMHEKIATFVQEFGRSISITPREYAEKVSCDPKTALKAIRYAINHKALLPEHYFLTASGYPRLYPEAEPIINKILETKTYNKPFASENPQIPEAEGHNL